MMTDTTFSPLEPTALSALQTLLSAQAVQYETLQATLAKKSAVLVEGKPKALAVIDQELMGLHRKITQLETERQVLMASMGHPQATLTQLIPHMPSSHSMAFIELRDRLERSGHDIARLNQENRDLLTLTLHWLQDTVNVISNALMPEGASYTAQPGKKHGQKPASNMAQSTITHSA